MPTYADIFENNRRWVASMLARDPHFFERLAAEQKPDFLFIGCSDSRVPANQIMGVEPGEVFVHRNIANVVAHTDLNVQSVISYAVEQLSVRHIVVCGHYGCGGIKAALSPEDQGTLSPWMRELHDVYRLHQATLSPLQGEALQRGLVEANIREQCAHVIQSQAVQAHHRTHGFPTVHGWVYDLHNGLLKDLEIDFLAELQRLRPIGLEG